MTVSTIRAGLDGYVVQARPAKSYIRNVPILRLQSGAFESYIKLKNPAPKGATVQEATLVLTQASATTGSKTVNANLANSNPHEFDEDTTWSNKPGTVTGTAATRTQQAGVGVLWELDVTAHYQAIVDGLVNRGFRLWTSSGDEIRFHSLDASRYRPYLRIRWGTRPQKPETLIPSFAAVSVQRWVQRCDYVDRSGADSLASVQVQIDPDGGWSGSNLWDSGEQPAEQPSLDLSEAWPGATLGGSAQQTYPGLASGETTQVRMRVRDNSGLWSYWSDAVNVRRDLKLGVTILAPAAAPNDKVFEFTPPITWSVTGGTQVAWRVTIARANNPKKLLHDTGRRRGNANTYTLPKRVLRDDRRYVVAVYVWDGVNREATTGDPTYTRAIREFAVDYDATVNPPSSVTAGNSTNGRRPWVDLTISRPASPDSWTVQRSDNPDSSDPEWETIAADVVPADVQVNGTTWRIRDWTARPGVPYRYRARAEVTGRLSPFAGVNYTPTCEGIWLLDPGAPYASQVVLGGDEFTGTATDQAVSQTVLGQLEVSRTIMGLTGLIGTVSNALIRDRPEFGLGWKDIEDRLFDIKSRPTDEFRLVLGDLNIPVVLGDIVTMPHPKTRGDQVLKVASFAFWQSGEHPYDVGL